MRKEQHALIDRLKEVLEIYGGEPSRWPTAERRNLIALVADNAEAALLQDEALALDRLLEAVRGDPISANDADAVLERALQECAEADLADCKGFDATESRTVISPQFGAKPWQRRATAPRGGRFWSAATLLAASLIAGFIIGASGLGEPAISPFVTAEAAQDVDVLGFFAPGAGLEPTEELL